MADNIRGKDKGMLQEHSLLEKVHDGAGSEIVWVMNTAGHGLLYVGMYSPAGVVGAYSITTGPSEDADDKFFDELRSGALADGLVPEYAHELGPCTKIKIVSDKATEIYAGSH